MSTGKALANKPVGISMLMHQVMISIGWIPQKYWKLPLNKI